MGQRDKYTKGSLKGQILIDEKNGQILGYPLQQGYGVPNIMAGNFVGPGGVASPTTSGSPGGFRVALPGYDVRSATDDQLLFDSGRKVFKVIAEDTVNVVIPSGYSAGTYDKLVTFPTKTKPPIVMAAVVPPYVSSTDRYNLPIPASSFVAGAAKWLAYTTVGLSYVDFTVDLQATGLSGVVGTWAFTYFILQQTAS